MMALSDDDHQTSETKAMLYAGNTIAAHTNEVRAMHWIQIGLSTVTMVIVAGSSVGQLFLMWLMYQQDERRHQEMRGLYVNQSVRVEQREGLFEAAVERARTERLGKETE